MNKWGIPKELEHQVSRDQDGVYSGVKLRDPPANDDRKCNRPFNGVSLLTGDGRIFNSALIRMPVFVLAFMAIIAAIVMLVGICSGIAVFAWGLETGESHRWPVLVIGGLTTVVQHEY